MYINSLRSVSKSLPAHTKLQFLLVLIISTLRVFCEILVLLTVSPFVASAFGSTDSICSPFVNSISCRILDYLSLPTTLIGFGVLFISSSLILSFLRLLSQHLSSNTAKLVGINLAYLITKKLSIKSVSSLDRSNSNVYLELFSYHIDCFTVALDLSILLITSALTTIFLFLGLIISDSSLIGVVIIPLIIIYALISRFTQRRLKANSHSVFEQRLEVSNLLQVFFTSFRELTIYNKRPALFHRINKSFSRIRTASANSQFLAFFPKELLQSLVILLIGILFFIKSRSATPLAAASLASYFAVLFFACLRILPSIQAVYYSISQINTRARSISFVLNQFSSFVSISSIIGHTSTHSQVTPHLDYSLSPPTSLLISDLSLSIGDKNLFNHLNFDSNGSKIIGLVGPSGSGKSSLLDAFLGITESFNGKIHYSDIHNNCFYSPKELLDNNLISFVPQNFAIINSSILDNIVFFDKHFRNDDFNDSLRMSCLSSLINQKLLSLTDSCGENGSQLSGGQAQRVAIARALYQRRPILVLDESTSAIDLNTEHLILTNLVACDFIKLVVFVTHRPESLRYCDTVINLSDYQ